MAKTMAAVQAAETREEMGIVIDAQGMHYRDLNRRLREAATEGEARFRLVNVNGQRYIGTGLKGDLHLEICGVPGNDLGAFLSGPTILVRNNAQDAIGNTMDSGSIIVKGDAGDVIGYGMRGGTIFINGNVGYRVGIHMKAYRQKSPVIVIGGAAGDFLGEYMAGGVIILLGLSERNGDPLVGNYCASGMHGGEIYLRGKVDPRHISPHAKIAQTKPTQIEHIRPHIAEFCTHFGYDADKVMGEPFFRLTPVSHRPYGAKYAT